MIEVLQTSGGALLPVLVRAGAGRNGILGKRNGMLRVAVAAAAEKGKANREIVDLLSDVLGVPKSAIEIVAGRTSSRKRLLIVGGNAEGIRDALCELLQTMRD
jgi:uncharacterized protein (TIGR00251 family)